MVMQFEQKQDYEIIYNFGIHCNHSNCGGINPYTLMAKLGPAQIDGFGPPKDDVRPG